MHKNGLQTLIPSMYEYIQRRSSATLVFHALWEEHKKSFLSATGVAAAAAAALGGPNVRAKLLMAGYAFKQVEAPQREERGERREREKK